ncbi:MAG: hypothetical protein GKR97_20300 [Rhizobiaceae bacterium]|nr:hypothetical protein [Rhizobiaceae bacterium]
MRSLIGLEECKFMEGDMRIATMATGGIGGFLAVKLSQIGHQVATIARGAHLESIAMNGLTLDGPTGMENVKPWKVTADPAEIGQVDVIILGSRETRWKKRPGHVNQCLVPKRSLSHFSMELKHLTA